MTRVWVHALALVGLMIWIGEADPTAGAPMVIRNSSNSGRCGESSSTATQVVSTQSSETKKGSLSSVHRAMTASIGRTAGTVSRLNQVAFGPRIDRSICLIAPR